MIKNPPANAGHIGDTGSIPGSERPLREGNGNPLQYSCLENSMDWGAWQATVHGVAKGQARLSMHTHTETHTHTHIHTQYTYMYRYKHILGQNRLTYLVLTWKPWCYLILPITNTWSNKFHDLAISHGSTPPRDLNLKYKYFGHKNG